MTTHIIAMYGNLRECSELSEVFSSERTHARAMRPRTHALGAHAHARDTHAHAHGSRSRNKKHPRNQISGVFIHTTCAAS